MYDKVTLRDIGNPKRETVLTSRGDITLRQVTTLDGALFVVKKNERKVGKPTKSINRALSILNKAVSETYNKKKKKA